MKIPLRGRDAMAALPLVDMLRQDVWCGLHRMRRQPGFTALVALTLALGVGANAAMFGLVDVLMFRTPAHVADPDRIVSVRGAETYVAYQQLRERLQALTLTAYTRPSLSLAQGADTVALRAECVTPSYFEVTGGLPWRGRTFTADDDARRAPAAAVLSYDLWRRHFAADPDVIGAPVIIAARAFDVIGIAPRGFTGIGLVAVDAWILLAASPEACSFTGTNLLQSTGGSWLTVAGRLRDGTTRAQAIAELAAVEPQLQERPRTLEGRFELAPLYASRRLNLSPDSRLALWLTGGAAVLFLLACANVTGLLWMQTLSRDREIAVRRQLGASSRRVFSQLLLEHLLMAVAGGTSAVLVATCIGQAVRWNFPAQAWSSDTARWLR